MLEPSHDNFSDLVARKQASEERKQAKHPNRQAWGVASNSDLERRVGCKYGLIVCTGKTCDFVAHPPHYTFGYDYLS